MRYFTALQDPLQQQYWKAPEPTTSRSPVAEDLQTVENVPEKV
jgi:hypothetical protein